MLKDKKAPKSKTNHHDEEEEEEEKPKKKVKVVEEEVQEPKPVKKWVPGQAIKNFNNQVNPIQKSI